MKPFQNQRNINGEGKGCQRGGAPHSYYSGFDQREGRGEGYDFVEVRSLFL